MKKHVYQARPCFGRSRYTLIAVALASGLASASELYAEEADQVAAASIDIENKDEPDALAETSPKEVVEIDRVTVSAASRINRPGFDAPTPTVSITAEELQIGAPANIAAALNELPQFKMSASARTDGTIQGGGRAPVNLRGLGVDRTLVLLDGRRFKGDNDLNSIPSILINGADIVTGGASAAWGSGAVAGVVNLTIDERFEGSKIDLRGGIADAGDGEEQAFSGALGHSFNDGRGHVVFGAEYYNNQGINPKTSRKNIGRWSQLSNGDGSYTITPDVSTSTAVGGLITSGTLSGYAFNPDASLYEFDYGSRNVGTNQVGGDGVTNDDYTYLTVPTRNYRLLGRVIYDITDSVKLTTQLRHARSYNEYKRWFDNNTGSNTLTISSDNAYLSDSVRTALEDAGESSFRLSRWNSDYGWPDTKLDRRTTEFTFALDGQINASWDWNAYYSHGEYNGLWSTPGWLLEQNYANAVDSVIDPDTGNPVCRIALTNPDTDCVPLNVFGYGNGSEAALDYVQGHPWRQEREQLDAGGVSLQGDLLQLPAGPLIASFGLEARHEAAHNWVDADSLQENYSSVSYYPIEGSFQVREAFGEALIPLAKDFGILKDLGLNLAARYSDYSTSGGVWQWKVGATNEFFNGFKARVAYSRDVRAPSITDLYSSGGLTYGTVADPFTNSTVSYVSHSTGNTELTPEESDTFTIGFSYSPVTLQGLSFSVDYFSIDIDDVITTVGVSEILNRCYNGNQTLCSKFVRDEDGSVTVQLSPVNLSNYKTDGIDLDVAYVTPASRFIPALQGGLNFRLLGSWINSLTTYDGITTIEYLNALNSGSGFGVPRLQLNALASYQGPRFGGNLRVRHISSGNYSNTTNITNNHIGSYTYFDLGFKADLYANLSSQLQLYANVNNLLDKAPPVGGFSSYYHDAIGRYYSLGLRMNF
jgi:iron complex outermembrane receptor protein